MRYRNDTAACQFDTAICEKCKLKIITSSTIAATTTTTAESHKKMKLPDNGALDWRKLIMH